MKQMSEKERDTEYEITKREFDPLLYLARRRDMLRAEKLDLVDHYIRTWKKENRIPAPFFQQSLYLERHPEAAHTGINPFAYWISEGRSKGEIAYPIRGFSDLCEIIGMEPARAQEELISIHKDVRARLAHGKLGEMVAKATELDPLIAHSWPAALEPRIAPFHSDAVVGRIVALNTLQKLAEFKKARFVIVLGPARWAPGKRMEGHILDALMEICDDPDDIVVVVAEQSEKHAHGDVPQGVRLVDFARFQSDLGPENRIRVLSEFLRSLRPEAVFNIDSRVMWNVVRTYGPAISHSFKTINCMAYHEQSELGFTTGDWVKNFYRTFDVSHSFGVDSQALKDELTERFLIPPSDDGKIVVLPTPVDPQIDIVRRPRQTADRRPTIFWAGPLDLQYRADLLFEIASALPDFDFLVWGECRFDNMASLPPKPDNMVFKGVFSSFEEIDLHVADAWLCTSDWDEMLSILLEVSMRGVPIVGPCEGRWEEVLFRAMSASGPMNKVEDYCRSLRKVVENPDEYRGRAIALRDRLISTRTPDRYLRNVKKLLGHSNDEV